MFWRGVINEITCLLGHERVMQVMRNCCSPTRLVVEGGGGGDERAKKAEAGRLGCAVSSRRYGTSSVLIMERRT